MAIIDRGQFFLHHNATILGSTKPKYFLVMNKGEEEKDLLLCLVLNTENRMNLYNVECNKEKQKFILSPDLHKFTFLKDFSALMLFRVHSYTVEELFEDDIVILEKDVADEKLLRQIKNCIDIKNLLPREKNILTTEYKIDKPSNTRN